MNLHVFIFITMFGLLSLDLHGDAGHLDWSNENYHKPWPTKITKDDNFFRGQATDLTSFQQMLDMLSAPNDSSLVTSRLFRTLVKLFPKKSLLELKPLVDSQLDWWRENRVIWQIVECHVDVYGCSMPSVKQLMGIIFKLEDLPDHVLDVYKRQALGGVSYLNPMEMSAVLEFFDPVVSTSFYKDVAEKFAKNKGDHIGYVMILNDRHNRNCSEKLKSRGDCFINHEEYLEEFEVPFWGYVIPEELSGFIVEDIKVLKSSPDFLIIEQLGKSLKLKTSKSSCKELNKFNFSSNNKQGLLKSLKVHLGCKITL